MYMTYHIFPVLPIKHLVNYDDEPTTQHKLETGAKTSVSNLRILFCTYVVRKSTAYVDTKVLNMRHQSQKGFGVSSLGFHNIKKGPSYTYLVHRE